MFRKALEKVGQFTFPVVVSRRIVGGGCSAGIGTFVIINKDGWILTAGHILRQWHQLVDGVESVKRTQAARDAIEKDAALSKKEKAVKLSPLVIGKDDSDNCSAWWGVDRVELKNFSYVPIIVPDFGEAVDIGVGRLDPFDPAAYKISNYPVFKNPDKNFEPGVSLCKLGYPLYQVTPTWNAQTNSFCLPPGTLPMPRFPIDGIFTRIAEIVIQGGQHLPYPIRYLETSTPVLRARVAGLRLTSTEISGRFKPRRPIAIWALI
jgi:hypothetical protein